MGLLPLEFTDCLTDSPYFRENLHAHERELDKTSQQIKGLIKEVKDLLSAAKTLSRAQRNLANTLSNFTFDCIGGSQTDDEIVIARSLKEFGRLLSSIEDERDRMLERASATFIEPIEQFRQHQIGGAKEGKKKFEKETTRFCSSLERHLNLSTKKSENHLQEADASLEMEQRHFVQASLEYVLKLQEVQERKKFEFVETILSFMYGWLTFYHQGHEAACEFKTFMTDLQVRVQRTRENYTATQNEAENLMQKMLEARKTKPQDPGTLNKMYTRQGYLFVMEKKAFGSTWIKHFCQYQKENRKFTMIPYNQTVSKISTNDTITLKECIRRMSDSIDKRFCFDIIPVEKPSVVYTFQALSEEDRKLWLDAMDGKDPAPSSGKSPTSRPDEYALDDFGFAFVRKCIEVIETRGLDDQGLYRVGGVASKITKLIQIALDRRKASGDSGAFNFDVNGEEWEIRTVTSALKHYFRNLPEPLMTYRLHIAFIAAAKQENRAQRIDLIHCLVHTLPKANFEMLHLLIGHLTRIAANCQKNLMTISNLGVCFGPTLLRPEEESIAAIMDIKFGNVVVEILIENCDKIFTTKPADTQPVHQPQVSSPQSHPMPQQVASVQPSGFLPNQGHPQQPIYGRVAVDPNNYTYATIPARGGPGSSQVFRSSSHDHLAGAQQQGHYPPKGRPVHVPANYVYQTGPGATAGYPVSYPQAQYAGQTGQLPPNGAQGQRPFRPMAMYSPWANAPHGPHGPMGVPGDNPLNMQSPATSSGSSSGDSLAAQHAQQQTQQSSPNSSPSGTPFYPNQMGNNARQAPQPYLISNSSSGSLSSGPPSSASPGGPGRRVRTLYACIGENATELSFKPNVIIFNVRPSKEPGWLEGFYNGKAGLIPENYVQFID